MNTEERERVERIAESVMGWGREAVVGGFWPGQDGGPEVLRITETAWIPWNPFVSAADDYMVLQKVRETWDEGSRARFNASLREDWTRRNPETAHCNYLVGDYADYALAVLDAQTQESGE